MYTAGCSAAGVCLIINSKCCSLQIKASGFSTKHSALISPKQVSVRYHFTFTPPPPSSPPLSSVPPTLSSSSADIGSSPANPLVTEKERSAVERWRGGRWRGRKAEEEWEVKGGWVGKGCREARSKLKTCFSIKTTASRTQWVGKQMCVCPDVSASSKIPIYTSEGPLIFISLFVLCCISISLRCLRSASQRWLQLRWNTLQAGSRVCVCVSMSVCVRKSEMGEMCESTRYTRLQFDLWWCLCWHCPWNLHISHLRSPLCALVTSGVPVLPQQSGRVFEYCPFFLVGLPG